LEPLLMRGQQLGQDVSGQVAAHPGRAAERVADGTSVGGSALSRSRAVGIVRGDGGAGVLRVARRSHVAGSRGRVAWLVV
jgi:hypothetical protein